ncbi:hypothetical protein CEXT_342421 [Caerostris extrusa]|uniref:Uncharacterized protein n=1 Tax=Caerostris extrusa TaxID=172846 RepID=A0AAV4WAA1_CAEEX|nr:hypothetical protein CEXT_342421 [Caerostris extrusa]
MKDHVKGSNHHVDVSIVVVHMAFPARLRIKRPRPAKAKAIHRHKHSGLIGTISNCMESTMCQYTWWAVLTDFDNRCSGIPHTVTRREWFAICSTVSVLKLRVMLVRGTKRIRTIQYAMNVEKIEID